MAYGDYDGPDKPDKGKENGSCNRGRCQCSPARWYNHGSLSWYCDDCRQAIEFDPVNLRDWQRNFQPKCGHPMFETRDMMTARLPGYTTPLPDGLRATRRPGPDEPTTGEVVHDRPQTIISGGRRHGKTVEIIREAADTVTLTPDEVEKIVKKAIAEYVECNPDDMRFRMLQCVFRDGTVCNGWPEIVGIFQ